MRTVQTITHPSGNTVHRVRFRHPTATSPTTGKPLQTSESFTVKAEAERFAKWHAHQPNESAP